jgi:hypothetical protein
MMKKIYVLLVINAILIVFNSCKKGKTAQPAEPADQFVGNYSYLMTYSGFGEGSETGTAEITKVNANTITISFVLQAGRVADVKIYTVDNNKITENPGQTIGIGINNKIVPYVENFSGTLNGNILSMSGTWSNSGYKAVFIKFTLTKS